MVQILYQIHLTFFTPCYLYFIVKGNKLLVISASTSIKDTQMQYMIIQASVKTTQEWVFRICLCRLQIKDSHIVQLHQWRYMLVYFINYFNDVCLFHIYLFTKIYHHFLFIVSWFTLIFCFSILLKYMLNFFN